MKEFKSETVVVLRHLKSSKRQTVHLDRIVPCNSEPYLSPDSQTSVDKPSTDTSSSERHNKTTSVTVTTNHQHQSSSQMLENRPTTTLKRPVRTKRKSTRFLM